MSDSPAFHFHATYTIDSPVKRCASQDYVRRRLRLTTVVTFAIPKGGSGKSTLLASTAVCALERGFSVIILDTDPRGDLVGWRAARAQEKPDVVEVDAARFSETIEGLRRDAAHDLIVIDTAGTESMLNEMASRAADLVVVPFGLNIFDVRAALKTADQHKRAERDFALVLTKCPPHRGRIDDLRSALSSIGEFAGVPFISRVAHHDAMARGLGVTELDAGGQAAAEARALWSWIEVKLDLAEYAL